MSRPARAAPPRGFTLVELVVATAVSALVVAAALTLMIGQQRAFTSGSDERRLQGSARVALDDLTTNLRLAGYGIDPALAFDFGPLPTYLQPQAPAGQLTSSPGQAPCDAPVTCRDRIGGSDELVFRYREPGFGHYLTDPPTAALLTINGPLPGGLRAGQVLQVSCAGGDMLWAYVTVDQDVAEEPAAVEVPVSLRAGNGAQFPLQNAFLAETCFQTVAGLAATNPEKEGATKVLRVDTFRYFVQAFDGRPYLMLDRGFDDPDSVALVAADVEDLQVSYFFPASPVPQQVAGSAENVRLAAAPAGIDLAPAAGAPTYTTPRNDPARTTHHPANIRAVRISATVRGTQARNEPDQGRLPAAGNRPELAGQPLHPRFLLETTVPTRNLDARAPIFPVWSLGDPAFNQGGG